MLKNTKLSFVTCFISLFLVIWFSLFIVCYYIDHGVLKHSVYGIIAWPMTFIAHILILAFLIFTYKHVEIKNRKMILWLLLIYIWLFLVDLFFYLATYTNSNYILNLKFVHFLLYYAPCIIYCFLMIIFLAKIALRDVLPVRGLVKITAILISINLITILLFLSAIHYAFNVISWETISQIVLFTLELVLFDCAILGLIYANNISIILWLSGTMLLIGGDFFITYSYISQTLHLFFYGELLWLSGLFSIMFAFMSIVINKHYSVETWLRKANSIKSKLAFWIFIVSISGFLSFFIIAYTFSILDKHVFINLPLIVLIYSVITVICSIFIGKTFEIPFKKIESNLEALACNNSYTKSNDDFAIEEFKFLQESIENSFKYRNERDKMKHEFGELVADVAHDLKSPIMSLNFAAQRIRNDNINETIISNLNEIDMHIKQIRNISSSVLTNYYQLTADSNNSTSDKMLCDDGNLARFLNLFNLLEGVITSKKSEWTNNPCNINLIADSFFREKLVYIAPTKILRIISNILNNSYQSLYNEIRNINIYLQYANNENLELIVEDSGCGINKEKIDEMLTGKSSKHIGKGIGLSSAINYLKDINGDLSINSEINKGTKIKIRIPWLPQPEWLNEKIEFNKNTVFVVVDDDPNIILIWQKIFSRVCGNGVYFLSCSEFLDWYSSNKYQEIILLIDYDLNDDINGFDIIANTNIKQIYVVTNHAEEQWLQEKVKLHNVRLIPKSRIDKMQIKRW